MSDEGQIEIVLTPEEAGYVQFALRLARKEEERKLAALVRRFGDGAEVSEARSARLRIGPVVEERVKRAVKAGRSEATSPRLGKV